MIDIFRVDNYTPASSYPYRARINGALLLDKAGLMARRFRSLAEAKRVAAKRAEEIAADFDARR